MCSILLQKFLLCMFLLSAKARLVGTVELDDPIWNIYDNDYLNFSTLYKV